MQSNGSVSDSKQPSKFLRYLAYSIFFLSEPEEYRDKLRYPSPSQVSKL